ncbi:MAG: ABC transporter permease [Chloroflexi bacterium]|nr:ABC transporter permease [Chloroflexota bacterium]
MRSLIKLTWVELKLFTREPVTLVFTLALPLILLLVLAEVFGNTPDPEGKIYRGVGPMDYYTPAYVGLVISAVGIIGLPVHLAGYRERGVLRRLRASSVSAWTVLGSQVAVSFTIAIIGFVLLTAATMLGYDVHPPKEPGLFAIAFVISTLAFASLGVLLGAVLPTARAAQLVGLLLFFVMMFVAGAGPPPEVLSQTLRDVAKVMPLSHIVVLLQDPWLGFGWNNARFLIAAGFLAAGALLSVKFFRWE